LRRAWGRTVTPVEFLALLESGREVFGTVCRDPEGSVYLIAPPGAEGRYVLEDFVPLGRFETWRERLRKGTLHQIGAEYPPTWLLKMDIEQANGRKEKSR